jgi:ATP-dependent Clp protease ATP-binding subunit ClpA
MFERFTNNARQVIVLAQEEARRLDHNYIGTEHVLLGLLAQPDSIARRALDGTGITLEQARARVEATIKRGKRSPSGHIPFTPRAKKVLELALREALHLGHNYIGTEHILLGLIREGEGLGAVVLENLGVDVQALRQQVIDMVPPGEGSEGRRLRRWLRLRGAGPSESPAEDVRTTTAADATLDQARRLAGDAAIGSHHLLLATLDDPASAAAKALGTLGIDLDQAREALRRVDVAGTTDELPEDAGRRRLVLRLTDTGVALETADPALVDRTRTAFEALGVSASGELPGDHPDAVAFAEVWEAWRLALDDLTARARRPKAS